MCVCVSLLCLRKVFKTPTDSFSFMDDEFFSTKTVELIIIVDYWTGKYRVVSRLNRKLKASEIPVRIKLKLKVSKPQELKVEGEVEVGMVKASEMLVEKL